MTAAHCAFERCQAGGVILPGAPRVIGGGRNRATTWHPGCYAASGVGKVEPEDTADVAVWACSCVDALGMPCPGVAGDDGWCDSCRSHAYPAPLEVFS